MLDDWIDKVFLNQGGQASTHMVRHRVTGTLGTLKQLSKNKDSERRSRFYREISILRSLNHPSIPKVIESNHDKFQDPKEKLYTILTYIPGTSLSEFQLQSASIDKKLNFILKLCEILKFAHENGVVHRDIKPDNIICRNDDMEDPVLIDFGLSFNEDIETELKTPDHQILGNRFLQLPELTSPTSFKRDHRSDVTMVSGIMFFLLTNDFPRILQDESLKKPHERKRYFLDIDPLISRNLSYILDIGFNYNIDNRFPDIESFTFHLQKIGDSTMRDDERAERIKRNIESRPDYLMKKYEKEIFGAFPRIISSEATNFTQKYPDFKVKYGQENQILGPFERRWRYGIENRLYSEELFFPYFECCILNNEVILYSRQDLDAARQIIYRFPICPVNEIPEKLIRAELFKYFEKGADKISQGN